MELESSSAAFPALHADVLGDLDRSGRLEWLETNGTGAFAMGTAAGLNTRRYHGLLIASLRPPVERFAVLSRLEERVEADGADLELGVNQYPGVIHPQGHRHLTRFDVHPWPTWQWTLGELTLEKQVFLIPGKQAVAVRYRSSRACRLTLRPMLACRDYHSLTHAGEPFDAQLEVEPMRESMVALGMKPRTFLPAVTMLFEGRVRQTGLGWYYRCQYREEQTRGLPFEEDVWCAGQLELELEGGPHHHRWFVACLGEDFAQVTPESLDALHSVEWSRRTRLAAATPSPVFSPATPRAPSVASASSARSASSAPSASSASSAPSAPPLPAAGSATSVAVAPTAASATLARVRCRLEAAADAYRARRADGTPTLLAGYPWFTDWGRDTMIAMRGLLIARGLLDEARDVLRGFLKHLHRGLIPNRFPDVGQQPEYNTADATLWLFVAAQSWVEAAGDPAFIRGEVLPATAQILDWHRRGTLHDIRIDSDGLLSAGSPGTQLTWMDAKVGDWVVTPRHGKAVELNALWFNALCTHAAWNERFGSPSTARALRDEADRTADAFRATFWNPQRRCLYDVVRPEGADPSLRPNQLFAVSLPYSALRRDEQCAVVDAVERELLTPVGLRTLGPREPGYRGRYRGDPLSRDGAYHQGTVWPWLLGPFFDARRAAYGDSARGDQLLAACAEALEKHLTESGCLGQLSEVFDAEAPHEAGGAPAQAWSVGELVRLLTPSR